MQNMESENSEENDDGDDTNTAKKTGEIYEKGKSNDYESARS